MHRIASKIDSFWGEVVWKWIVLSIGNVFIDDFTFTCVVCQRWPQVQTSPCPGATARLRRWRRLHAAHGRTPRNLQTLNWRRGCWPICRISVSLCRRIRSLSPKKWMAWVQQNVMNVVCGCRYNFCGLVHSLRRPSLMNASRVFCSSSPLRSSSKCASRHCRRLVRRWS